MRLQQRPCSAYSDKPEATSLRSAAGVQRTARLESLRGVLPTLLSFTDPVPHYAKGCEPSFKKALLGRE